MQRPPLEHKTPTRVPATGFTAFGTLVRQAWPGAPEYHVENEEHRGSMRGLCDDGKLPAEAIPVSSEFRIQNAADGILASHNFKNTGREWALERRPGLDHDFRSDATGIAIHYGIYLPIPNLGMVFVGTAHDTPEFAVDCVEAWWRTDGCARFHGARRLLILADGGGSNGARCRAWK